MDAAIATLVCNGAVHSHSLGLGGGFFMTVFIRNEGKSYFLNARETAPGKAHEMMYEANPSLSNSGPMAIAVPGELKGLLLKSILSPFHLELIRAVVHLGQKKQRPRGSKQLIWLDAVRLK